MHGALLLLVLLLCRGGAIDETETSQGSQSSGSTLPPTSNATTIKTDASPPADISKVTPVLTTITLLGTSAPLSTAASPVPEISTAVADPKKVTNTPPSTGTLPSASTLSHTDASATSSASTLTPTNLSPPITTAGSTTLVPEVVSSITLKSMDSLTGTSPVPTVTSDARVISSSVATAGSVTTLSADVTGASTRTTATVVPSSTSALSDTSGPVSSSPAQKPETSTYHSDASINVGNDHTTRSTSQAPGTTMKGTTETRKTTAAAPGQSGVPHTSSSMSTSVNFSKISSSTHDYASVPTATRVYPPNQIVCVDQNPGNASVIILTLNKPSPCDGAVDVSLHETLCKAVKPTFRQSHDNCTVHRAATGYPPNRLAVLSITVITYARSEELFEMLAAKKRELQKAGISNITYTGKHVEDDDEDRLSTPLIITIVCMACALLLVAAIYACCHQRAAHRKDQQRLTEELQTMENGYHDNPTLEVMETSSEMQEKKVNLNGELGDSWIVPLDSFMKEEPEEEDTHL